MSEVPLYSRNESQAPPSDLVFYNVPPLLAKKHRQQGRSGFKACNLVNGSFWPGVVDVQLEYAAVGAVSEFLELNLKFPRVEWQAF